MSTQIIRRFTSYVAVPVVSAGILGAAAVGLSGIANASTEPAHDGGALASVQSPALASVQSPALASVQSPALASVMPRAKLASVKPRASVQDPAGKKASAGDAAQGRKATRA